jgi:Kef-type K+ transport system membrane component KefB
MFGEFAYGACWIGSAVTGHAEGMDMAHAMVRLVLELSVILIAARVGGGLFRHYLKLPSVLGEVTAGMLIGPFALGALDWPLFGVLFPLPEAGMPLSPELYGFATLGSVILLFLAGLETDLALFFRYSVAGTVIGIFGVLFSFVLGSLCAVWFGIAPSLASPPALFLGTIATATSVGITARILSERRKADTPEGVTIMAAAVLDDVMGIILLAVVVGLAKGGGDHHSVDWGRIGLIAAKAFGFWLVCTAAAILAARRISRLLKISSDPATIASLALGLALLLAGLAETAGLAMIIGAYIMGLSLSRTDLVLFLQDQLQGAYDLLVPVFFCIMGMLVDFSAMKTAVLLGIVYTVLGILSKVLGCAIPALFLKFNLRGGLRIGVGMLPRGEVALIIAGVGLSSGTIGAELFGVAVMMTMLTTLMAPPLLVQLFKGGPGTREGQADGVGEDQLIRLEFPSPDIAEFLLARLVRTFRQEEFYVHRLHMDSPVYQLHREDLVFSLEQRGKEIVLTAGTRDQHVARLIILEVLVELQDLFESCQQMKNLDSMQQEVLKGMFGASG